MNKQYPKMTKLEMFVEAKKYSDPGWICEFEEEVALVDSKMNYPTMTGIYSSMLDELIDAIGADLVEDILNTRARLKKLKQ